MTTRQWATPPFGNTIDQPVRSTRSLFGLTSSLGVRTSGVLVGDVKFYVNKNLLDEGMRLSMNDIESFFRPRLVSSAEAMPRRIALNQVKFYDLKNKTDRSGGKDNENFYKEDIINTIWVKLLFDRISSDN